MNMETSKLQRHLILFASIFIIALGCKEQNYHINPENVASIRLDYLPMGEMSPVAIVHYKEILRDYERLDTTLTSKQDIAFFLSKVNELQVSSNDSSSYDLCSVATIRYNDGNERHVSFSQFGATVLDDDVRLQDAPELYEWLVCIMFTKRQWKILYDRSFKTCGLRDYLKTPESDSLFNKIYQQRIVNEGNRYDLFYMDMYSKQHELFEKQEDYNCE